MTSPAPSIPPKPQAPPDKALALRAQQVADPEAQLTAMRGIAQNWRNALLGLTTIVGTIGLLGGASSASDLTPGRRLLVLVLFIATFACLVIGSLTAANAAFGELSKGRTRGLLTGEQLRDYLVQEIDSVRNYLRWSRRLVIAGVVGLSLIAITVYSNPAQAAPLVQVRDRKRQLCGTLLGAGTEGIRIETTDEAGRKKTETVSLASLQALRPVGGC
jgi:peptidoglycan/LPS O-acetylase OafA/YrhL